ncbi:MAG TPA: phosphoribosylformylglycinamidine synthase subunit PurS [Acidimicrobiales bacterium]|nr:phosphoribosylformylglycinamidine synthase subunit PurS [Acidimicrobiales bacterium]
MRFEATVEIRGLDGLADPEGQTIERAPPALGFSGVDHVHVGKVIRLGVDADDESAAMDLVRALCDRLLANPVIEHAEISLRSTEAAAGEA